jgi:hypothetical protein
LTLLVGNVGEVGIFAGNRVLAVMLLGEILLLMILRTIYDNWQKVGFVAFMLTVLIFSYGHIYSLLEESKIAGLLIGRHRYLLIVWMVLICLVIYSAGKIKDFSVFEDTAKLVSFGLVVFSLIRLTAFYYMEWQALQGRFSNESAPQDLQAEMPGNPLPDVYYIILDAYGRSDVLADDFDVDNTNFLNSLRSLGFFIADCGQSNYAHTRLSLASSLNYSYLEDLGSDFKPGNDGWADLTGLIRKNAIRRFLEEKKYHVIAFETGYAWTEWRDADRFVESKEKFFSKNLTSFEALFLHTTISVVAVDFGWIPDPRQDVRHYELISSNLDALEGLAGEYSPKFVFAHLVIPHHPFVFGADGEFRRDPSLSPAFEKYTDEEYYNGYRQQVIFINDRILNIVESILSHSEHPPIIIIQGDHGPSHASRVARMSILNAYYLPDYPFDQLDASITPVNTFRLILDAYFDQTLPILPNISYFSKDADPYTYSVISNNCKP